MSSKMFQNRILNHLLPEFCNDRDSSYDVAGFKPNFHDVTEYDAGNFLSALDAGLAVRCIGRPSPRSNPLYWASQSRQCGEQLFWEYERSITPRPLKIWIEPIITIATLCRLHFEFGWPKHLVGTQSVDGAFDVIVFLDTDLSNEYIACEVKKTDVETVKLIRVMHKFGALAVDAQPTSTEKNAYNKVKALRARRAPFFWAVGPGGKSNVFKLKYADDGVIAFEETSIQDLHYPALSIVQPKDPN